MSRTTTRLLALATAALGLAVAVPAGAHTTPKALSHLASAGTPGAVSHRAYGEFAPAAAIPQLLTQPDGSTVRAVMTDVEVGGAMEANGFSIGKDSQGVWRYASGRDSRGRMVLTGVPANVPPPAGLAAGVARQAPAKDDKEAQAKAGIQRQLRVASAQAQQAAAAGGPRVFKFPAIMLATWWDTDRGQTSPQFQDGTSSTGYFKRLLDGFGGNPQGSLTEFYYEGSFGQFLVQVDVYGPYTSARSVQDRCYYGGLGQTQDDGDLDPLDTTLGVGGGGALGMTLEAVPQADVDINFADYDNNGDGKVDFFAIIHSGADMAVTGDLCNTWSHALQATLGEGQVVEQQLGLPAGTLNRAGIPTNDGVTVDRVFTMPEFESASSPLTIGVATHEMGHAIGEPDYYDTSYSSIGTGDFDIMAGGSYLGSPSGSNPTMFNPATRVFQGWITPTIVHGDLRSVKLQPRNVRPGATYTAGTPDPNLLLVPTYEVAVGGTDSTGHVWSEQDVYGLAKDTATNKYVIEGYYLENVNRVVNLKPVHSGQTRSPLFDRKHHGNGLLAWHYDAWRRSNVYFGNNDAQNSPDRYQLDVMEFDKNDNTQELQLNLSRGNADDYLVGAATGITSGTRQIPDGLPTTTGNPSNPVDISGGPTVAGVPSSDTFTVPSNPNNQTMTVTAGSDLIGDCTLSVKDPTGKTTGPVDSGGPGAAESLTIKNPIAGTWTATVGEFAGCGTWSGRVVFGGAGFSTSGAADTWSTWTHKPTGWAFTNVGPKDTEGLDSSADSGKAGQEGITLDVLNLTGKVDVSPGFVGAALNSAGGRGTLIAGRANAMSVPVFSNGSKAPSGVTVTVHEGSASGPVVATKAVALKGFSRVEVPFTYTPKTDGYVRLVAVVDEGKHVAEASESNNAQSELLVVTPANPTVLVVDDDSALGGERAIEGGLAALGVSYASVSAHPTAAQLKGYQAVIWEAGVDRLAGQLDPSDRATLITYLNGGGKLLYSGNRIVSALGQAASRTAPGASDAAAAFLGHYFGARLTDGSYTVSVYDPITATGTGLLAGQKPLLQPYPARQFVELGGLSGGGPGPNGITNKPFGTARGVLTLPLSQLPTVKNGTDKPYLGISVDGDAAHKHFQTVTLGYNMAQHSSADSTVQLLRSVLKHFGVALGTAPAPTGTQVFSAPVRDYVTNKPIPVAVTALGATDPVVLHYRRHGQGGYYALKMTPGRERGTYNGRIPAKAVTPDGIDYYVTAGSGLKRTADPIGALTGVHAHSIGVQLPEVYAQAAVLKADQVVAGAPATTGNLPATGPREVLALLGLVLLGCAGLSARRGRAHTV